MYYCLKKYCTEYGKPKSLGPGNRISTCRECKSVLHVHKPADAP